MSVNMKVFSTRRGASLPRSCHGRSSSTSSTTIARGRTRERGLAQELLLDALGVDHAGLGEVALVPVERGGRDRDAGPRPHAPVPVHARPRASLQHPLPERERGRLGPRRRADPGEQLAEPPDHGRLVDPELVGDLLVRPPLDQVAKERGVLVLSRPAVDRRRGRGRLVERPGERRSARARPARGTSGRARPRRASAARSSRATSGAQSHAGSHSGASVAREHRRDRRAPRPGAGPRACADSSAFIADRACSCASSSRPRASATRASAASAWAPHGRVAGEPAGELGASHRRTLGEVEELVVAALGPSRAGSSASRRERSRTARPARPCSVASSTARSRCRRMPAASPVRRGREPAPGLEAARAERRRALARRSPRPGPAIAAPPRRRRGRGARARSRRPRGTRARGRRSRAPCRRRARPARRRGRGSPSRARRRAPRRASAPRTRPARSRS